MSIGVSWDAPRPLSRSEQVKDRYRLQPRVEACACGGQISAQPFDEVIRAKVGEHQQSLRHRLWARGQGFGPAQDGR